MHMFDIIKACMRSKVVSKLYSFGRYYLSKSTTNMPIDGCWWWHQECWLHAMHQVWAAEGSCQSFGNNFQYSHLSTLPMLARGHSRNRRGLLQTLDKHLVDDV